MTLRPAWAGVRHTEGLMELGKGTVYPALRKLERYQLIHCREELRGPSAHPTRVFEIAPAGWVVLAAETSKWRPGLIR
ncbi:MAG TPA: helix-turn-helix transcriptional regulator [Candidatus Saccharimonadia bacterium]